MRCAPRLWRAGEIGVGRRLALAFAIGLVLAAAAMASAQAQILPSPSPTPTPGITIISSEISANNAVSNLGSSFLERLGNQATNGANSIGRTNPSSGGASEAAEAPKVRAWGEAYGISSTTDRQGDFAGDRRTTRGGVVGVGATFAPASASASPSTRATARSTCPRIPERHAQSHPARRQFSIDKGPWTVAGAFVTVWPDQFNARHRRRLCVRQLQRCHRRRADRTRLLLDPEPEPRSFRKSR